MYWVVRTSESHLSLCHGPVAPGSITGHPTAKAAWREAAEYWTETLNSYRKETARVEQTLRFAELGLFSVSQQELQL